MKLTTKSILSALKNIGFYFALTLPLLGQSISISAQPNIHAVEPNILLLLDDILERNAPLEEAQANNLRLLIADQAIDPERRARLAATFFHRNLELIGYEDTLCELISNELVSAEIRADLASSFLVRYPNLDDPARKIAICSLIKDASVPATIQAELTTLFLFCCSTLGDSATKTAVLIIIKDTSVPAGYRALLTTNFLLRYPNLDDSIAETAVLSLIRDASVVSAKIRAELADSFLLSDPNLDDPAAKTAICSLIKNMRVPAKIRVRLAIKFLYPKSSDLSFIKSIKTALCMLIMDESVPADDRTTQLTINFLARYSNLGDPAAGAAILSLIRNTSVPATIRAKLTLKFLFRNLPLDTPTTEAISTLISNNDVPAEMRAELDALLKAKKPIEPSAAVMDGAAATVAPGGKRSRDEADLTNNLPAAKNANQPTDTPAADINNSATTATSPTNTVNNIQPANGESGPSNLKTADTVTPMVQSTANADTTPAKEYALFLTFIKKISSIRQLITSGSYDEEEVKRRIEEIQTKINNNAEALTSAQLRELTTEILFLNRSNDEVTKAKIDTTQFSLEQEEKLNSESTNSLYNYLLKNSVFIIPSANTLLLGKQFLMPKFHQKYRYPSF